MTDGPQYFDDLVTKIDELADKIINDLVDKANWVAGKLNDAATGVLETLGHLWPGESDVEKAIDKWNNEILPAIQGQIDQLKQKVADALGRLAGEPMTLIGYFEKFVAAKSSLYFSNTLNQDITNLGNTWEGAAYNSYSTVAGEQTDALLALSNALQGGADLTSNAADRILSLWLDLYTNFYTFQSSALDVIGSFADVGKALGAEISPILSAVALVWEKINEFAVTLATFFKDQVTSTSLGWQKLGSGADGLPQNHWPKIAESSSDTMNDPDNWPGAA